jgi:hypothetical protein
MPNRREGKPHARRAWTVAEAALFGAVYVGLALIGLRLRLRLASAYLGGGLERLHRALLEFQHTNNEQSRVFQWLIPELIVRATGLSILDAYVLQRWLFTALSFIAFHLYLRAWFSRAGAFAGVALLAAILPLGYMNDLQESAPLLALTFVLGLWAIREHATVWYVVVLTIGALNNETMLFLPAVYFFYRFEWRGVVPLIRLGAATALTALPAFAIVGTMRYITRDRPHLGGWWHWPDNIRLFLEHATMSPLSYWRADYLYPLFFFGALWIYALIGLRDRPLFLRRAALVIPLFMIGHLLTGIIREVRQLTPIAYLIIPLALCFLFPDDRARRDMEPCVGVDCRQRSV